MRTIFVKLTIVLLCFAFFALLPPLSAQAGDMPDGLIAGNQINRAGQVNGTSGTDLTAINGKGAKLDMNFAQTPLYFIVNKGQVNGKAKFYAKASRYTLWLTGESLVFDSQRRFTGDGMSQGTTFARDVSRLVFQGANKNPQMVPLDAAQVKVNYFVGKDKSKWRSAVPTSMAVLYKNLYKGINLKVYGIEKSIEYDWVVKPAANPGEIKFEYRDVKGTGIDAEGNLLVKTGAGELMHKKPVSYQVFDGERKAVDVKFKRIATNTYGFDVGDYDKSRELVIDPVVLAYSTYLGGADNELFWDIALDDGGNAYVTGVSYGSDFPVLGQYQSDQGGYDAVIARFDTTKSGASSLIWSTYLGGGDEDWAYGIAVDGSGNVYVAGYTDSTDFPTLNPFQSDQTGRDAFIAKLDGDMGGSGLLYSTYLGGSGDDRCYGIAVDGSGQVYVTGSTASTDFPTHNEYQGNRGEKDAFVTRLDTTAGAAGLVYSTYLGGDLDDSGSDIALDANDAVYITGSTRGSGFPVLNELQAFGGGYTDAFVAKVDTSGSGASSLIYSTYLGGDHIDTGGGIAVDGSGNTYVVGRTESYDFPTLNEYQGYQGSGWNIADSGDVFVTRLNAGGSGSLSLAYSTYLGGFSYDIGSDIAVDNSGNAYVVGQSVSPDFPIVNHYQEDQSVEDVVIAWIDTNQNGASSLVYSTYLGGEGMDFGRGIALDADGNVYLTGYTFSNDFPTMNPYQAAAQQRGYADGFVTRLSFSAPPVVNSPTVTDITSNTATLGGNIADAKGQDIVDWGIYWSTDRNFKPPVEGTREPNYGLRGSGQFANRVSGLPLNTTIYFNAYAGSVAGKAFSAQRSFITLGIMAPTVTTVTTYNITSNLASSGGDVVSDGGKEVTAKGVCWSTSPNPTTADSHTVDGTGTGPFISEITGLTPKTTYYVRAYATNSEGTAYGDEDSFITAIPPHIELGRNGLNFGAIRGGAQTGTQDFMLNNTGGGSFEWTATPLESWITVSPASDSGERELSVSVDASNLAVGSYRGTISIAAANADNSPVNVDIYLEVIAPGDAKPPIGYFDSPDESKTLFSSVSVSGWVLDDTEVSKVEIYRDPVKANEKDLVYIGDAVLVDGARSDIETKYPEYPKNYQGGWGYLMLTNALPNGGNGSYVIRAFATDNSGNRVPLGSKKIVCDNSTNVKPFGALDTPTQGGIASGTDFVNFGWALTAKPNTIPIDGSTIMVWVDGEPLPGHPAYNVPRKDLAARFPDYNNSAGPGGFYFINTRMYRNGVHRIAWSVKDDAGNMDGIGSRYFKILNEDLPQKGPPRGRGKAPPGPPICTAWLMPVVRMYTQIVFLLNFVEKQFECIVLRESTTNTVIFTLDFLLWTFYFSLSPPPGLSVTIKNCI